MPARLWLKSWEYLILNEMPQIFHHCLLGNWCINVCCILTGHAGRAQGNWWGVCHQGSQEACYYPRWWCGVHHDREKSPGAGQPSSFPHIATFLLPDQGRMIKKSLDSLFENDKRCKPNFFGFTTHGLVTNAWMTNAPRSISYTNRIPNFLSLDHALCLTLTRNQHLIASLTPYL